jgi:hypothetical protein
MLAKLDAMLKIGSQNRTCTAVLLGSGSSIRNITDDQWHAIGQYDTWTTNNWVYHPFFVPKYYMVETKWYGYDILQRRFKQKWELYKDTHFLFGYGKRIRMQDGRRPYLRDVVPRDAKRWEYTAIPRDAKRTHQPFTAEYTPKDHSLTKSYDMSMTLMFELLYKMGYEEVVLFGIDLHDSYYFWSGGEKQYGEVHHHTNKEHEGKDPKAPHATHRIADFIFDFHERWMVPTKRNIFVGHQNTMLFPRLKYRNITV